MAPAHESLHSAARRAGRMAGKTKRQTAVRSQGNDRHACRLRCRRGNVLPASVRLDGPHYRRTKPDTTDKAGLEDGQSGPVRRVRPCEPVVRFEGNDVNACRLRCRRGNVLPASVRLAGPHYRRTKPDTTDKAGPSVLSPALSVVSGLVRLYSSAVTVTAACPSRPYVTCTCHGWQQTSQSSS